MTGTQEGRRVVNVPLFLNGEGMRGGRVHPHVARYPFLGEARTAPRYRFYVYQDRFPALWPVHDGGVSVPGELIELPLEAVRDEFLPVEPPELELGVIELDDGTEAGAWLSVSIAAHELIYVADAHGLEGRLHHLAFWVDTREEVLRAADLFLDAGIHIEAAPSKHAIAQGFFLYGIEPGGNRVEVTTGGYFVYDPDPEPTVWTEAERAKV